MSLRHPGIHPQDRVVSCAALAQLACFEQRPGELQPRRKVARVELERLAQVTRRFHVLSQQDLDGSEIVWPEPVAGLKSMSALIADLRGFELIVRVQNQSQSSLGPGIEWIRA